MSSGRQDPDRLTPVEPTARPDFPAGAAGRVAPEGSWLGTLRRFLVFIAAANLVWEFAQLPLYTLWYEGSPGEIKELAENRIAHVERKIEALQKMKHALLDLAERCQGGERPECPIIDELAGGTD